MNNETNLKSLVKEKYSAIARSEEDGCCGAGLCCGESGVNLMADDYSRLPGYAPGADLGLGCGLPTELAAIREGELIVDLGCGAGNDAFVATRLTGTSGKVIGVDFSEPMIARARENATKLDVQHVEFRLGDIESLPVASNTADLVISNCVLNLVPNKHRAFSEIFRVLRPGGRFCISDIVLERSLPAKWKEVAELYAGCVSGAILKEQYLSIVREAGFLEVGVRVEKRIHVPIETLAKYVDPDDLEAQQAKGSGILSITLTGSRPAKDDRNCCEPGSGCC